MRCALKMFSLTFSLLYLAFHQFEVMNLETKYATLTLVFLHKKVLPLLAYVSSTWTAIENLKITFV